MGINRLSGASKKLLSSLIVLLIFLPFQNCSQVKFESLGSLVGNNKSSANGDGYNGKPNYYRLFPDFTCESKVSPVASIEVGPTTSTLIENKKLACGTNRQTLDSALIDTSIYQRDIIGYREGIFEGSDSTPSQIPANLVEIWCRDTKDETGIETITHYNRESQLAVTRIYYSAKGSYQQISDFAVSRAWTTQKITVRDTKGFDLQVFRNQLTAQPGVFKAHLEALIEGQKISKETSCRLGGSFDAKIWPVPQIVDSNINQLQFSPDNTSFAFTSASGSKTTTYALNLFSSDILGIGVKQVSPNMLQYGARDFTFTADSKSLVYWGDTNVGSKFELMKVNSDGSGQLRMSPARQDNPTQAHLRLSGDGQRLVFSPVNPTYLTLESILQSVPLVGGAPVTLNLPVPNQAFNGVFNFEVSKAGSRVAFLAGDAANMELYIADADGQNFIKPIIQLPGPGWRLANGHPDVLRIPGAGNLIILKALTNGVDQVQDYAVSLDGQKVQALPPLQYWEATSPNEQRVLMSTWNKQTSHYGVFNLQTSSFVNLPDLKQFLFTKDSLSIIGLSTNAQSLFEPVSIFTDTGVITNICPAAAGTAVKVKEISDGEFLISSVDGIHQILNIFVKKPGSDCLKKNSMSLDHAYQIDDMVLSPDLLKLLITLRLTVGNDVDQQIAFLPMNGELPVMITAPVYFGARIQELRFLNDSSGVVYVGNQISSGQINAYFWRIPLK